MAVVSGENLLKRISECIGEDNSDEALSLLEDASDTIADFEERESEDWKTKYEENDAEWRKKYRERFENRIDDIEKEETIIETKTYDDLFSEVK